MQRTYQLQGQSPIELNDDVRARLIAAAQIRHFTHGQFIQHQGDRHYGLWYVIDGLVVSGRFGRNGRFVAFAVLGPGDLVGEAACFADIPRQSDLIAEGAVRVAWLDRAAAIRLMREHPDLAVLLLKSLGYQLAMALNRLAQAHDQPSDVRLARHLIELPASDDGDVTITQQEMGDLLGLSRVTLGAALAKLQSEQLVERGYGKIRIPDRARLAKWVQDRLN